MDSPTHPLINCHQNPVSRKSGPEIRVTLLPSYIQNEGVSRHETLQLFYFFIPFTTYEKSSFKE